MGRVLTIIFGIIVLLVALLLIAPFFIDLNDYKAEISAEVKKATGRDLVIDGDIDLALLPTPSLAVSGARFANIEGGSAPDMISVGDLDVTLALAPLLSARIDVEKVRLNEPVVLLEVLADGRRNWELQTAEEGAGAVPEQGGGLELSLQNVVIANGTLIWRDHREGSERRIEDFSARLRADSLDGPFSGTVSLVSDEVPLAADFTLGSIAGNTDLPVTLTGRIGEDAVRVVLNGTVTDPQGTPAFTGRIEAESEDISRIAAISPAIADLPAMQLDARADISADAERASASDLNLLIGESQLRGSAEVALAGRPRAKLDLAAARIDADPWLAFAGGGDQEGGNGGEDAAPALPGDFDAELNLQADILTLRGDVLREARFAGALEAGVLRIETFHAVLPGAATADASGRLEVIAGAPRFTGAASLKAEAFRRTLAWLGVDETALPAGRLTRFEAAADIEAAPDRVTLSKLQAGFDETKVSGGLIVQPGARLGIGARLAVDSIDLDAYRTDAANDDAAEDGGDGNPLAALDANLILDIGRLVSDGYEFRDVDLDAGIVQGVITLNAARIGDFGGAAIEASGTLREIQVAPEVDLKVALDTNDANALMRTLGEAPVSDTKLPLAARGTLKGGFTEMALNLDIESGPDSGRVTGTIADPIGTPNFDLDIDFDAADANRMLGIAGQPPLGGGAVPLALKGSLAGTAQAVTLDIAATSGRHNLTASGNASALDATPAVDLSVTLDTPNLNALMALFGQPPVGEQALPATLTGKLAGTAADMQIDMAGDVLGGSASARGTLRALETAPAYSLDVSLNVPDVDRLAAVLGSDWRKSGEEAMPVRFAGRVDGDPDGVRASGIDGALGTATFTGEAGVVLSGPRPNITASLSMGEVPVRRLQGPGGGSGGGSEGWSDEPIGFAALRDFDGRADIRAQALLMADYTIRNAVIEARLTGGVLTLSRFTGDIFDGRMDLTATVDARRDAADIAGTLMLDQVNAKDTLKALADFNRFSGPVSLDTTFSSRGASQKQIFEALNADGSLAGTLTYEAKAEDMVGGILANVLSSQVRQVKGISDSLNFVMQGFANRPAQLSGDYTVREGVFSTRYIELISNAAAARASGTVNLGRSRMDMLVEAFRQGDQEPYNTVNLKGDMGNPDVKLGGSAFRREQPQQQQPAVQEPAPQPGSEQPVQEQPQQQPAQEQQQEQSGGGKQQKPKAEDVIKNVLDNLLKKKN